MALFAAARWIFLRAAVAGEVPGPGHPLTAPTGGQNGPLKTQKTRRSESFRTSPACRWWRVEGPRECYDSPRCLSSHRSSRLLMNDPLGFPDFREPAAEAALPAVELRMVAK